MKNDKAILDTSVLICLYQLNLLEYLFLIFNNVRVPRKVEEEFLKKGDNKLEESKRYDFLENFYSKNSSWFIKCFEYSDDLIAIYTADKKIDDGEAEVFAQNQALGNDYIMLLDEKNARRLAKMNKLAHNGVLHILANFDLRFKICNYHDSVSLLREQFSFRLNDQIISEAYKKVKKIRE